MRSKKYTVKEGHHKSGFHPNLYFDVNRSKYEVIFTESCLYKFDNEDDADINKLFGLSFGYHHKNSVRFGWNSEDGKIAIYAYCYKLSQRYMRKIVSIPINSKHIFEINVYDAYYELKITNNEGELIGCANIAKAKTTKIGYRLFPYFGGNRCAPHDVNIWMKKIT
jgi:hypothetical protein